MSDINQINKKFYDLLFLWSKQYNKMFPSLEGYPSSVVRETMQQIKRAKQAIPIIYTDKVIDLSERMEQIDHVLQAAGFFTTFLNDSKVITHINSHEVRVDLLGGAASEFEQEATLCIEKNEYSFNWKIPKYYSDTSIHELKYKLSSFLTFVEGQENVTLTEAEPENSISSES